MIGIYTTVKSNYLYSLILNLYGGLFCDNFYLFLQVLRMCIANFIVDSFLIMKLDYYHKVLYCWHK